MKSYQRQSSVSVLLSCRHIINNVTTWGFKKNESDVAACSSRNSFRKLRLWFNDAKFWHSVSGRLEVFHLTIMLLANDELPGYTARMKSLVSCCRSTVLACNTVHHRSTRVCAITIEPCDDTTERYKSNQFDVIWNLNIEGFAKLGDWRNRLTLV